MEHTDVCFAPVLRMDEAARHPHNVERGTFVEVGGVTQPAPAPRFSRTPATIDRPPAHDGEHTAEVLREWGFAERTASTPWSTRAQPGRPDGHVTGRSVPHESSRRGLTRCRQRRRALLRHPLWPRRRSDGSAPSPLRSQQRADAATLPPGNSGLLPRPPRRRGDRHRWIDGARRCRGASRGAGRRHRRRARRGARRSGRGRRWPTGDGRRPMALPRRSASTGSSTSTTPTRA